MTESNIDERVGFYDSDDSKDSSGEFDDLFKSDAHAYESEHDIIEDIQALTIQPDLRRHKLRTANERRKSFQKLKKRSIGKYIASDGKLSRRNSLRNKSVISYVKKEEPVQDTAKMFTNLNCSVVQPNKKQPVNVKKDRRKKINKYHRRMSTCTKDDAPYKLGDIELKTKVDDEYEFDRKDPICEEKLQKRRRPMVLDSYHSYQTFSPQCLEYAFEKSTSSFEHCCSLSPSSPSAHETIHFPKNTLPTSSPLQRNLSGPRYETVPAIDITAATPLRNFNELSFTQFGEQNSSSCSSIMNLSESGSIFNSPISSGTWSSSLGDSDHLASPVHRYELPSSNVSESGSSPESRVHYGSLDSGVEMTTIMKMEDRTNFPTKNTTKCLEQSSAFFEHRKNISKPIDFGLPHQQERTRALGRHFKPQSHVRSSGYRLISDGSDTKAGLRKNSLINFDKTERQQRKQSRQSVLKNESNITLDKQQKKSDTVKRQSLTLPPIKNSKSLVGKEEPRSWSGSFSGISKPPVSSMLSRSYPK